MTAERKIDLSTYNGPMTVVGYPDFSIAARVVKTDRSQTSATAVLERPASTTQNPGRKPSPRGR